MGTKSPVFVVVVVVVVIVVVVVVVVHIVSDLVFIVLFICQGTKIWIYGFLFILCSY